jgi:aryl-alcohol dehydrogenase-like predicted oxidoreductase
MLAQDSEAMLSHYREQGGNFIDTANAYTCGHSEEIIGDFFHQPKGKRDRAVIATAEERRFNGQVHTGERRKDAGLKRCTQRRLHRTHA